MSGLSAPRNTSMRPALDSSVGLPTSLTRPRFFPGKLPPQEGRGLKCLSGNILKGNKFGRSLPFTSVRS
jgi:hypothetical protein